MLSFFKDFIYLFLEEGKDEEREALMMCERNTDQLSFAHPQLGTWPTTQACALTRNLTNDLSVCRLTLNPLSHTSQGSLGHFLKYTLHQRVLRIKTDFYQMMYYIIQLSTG